jgi:hypothetical protein
MMAAILVAATLSLTAVGQCFSVEEAPIDSRARRLLAPNGQGIVHAEITVFDASRKVLLRTLSDSHGKFSIPRLKKSQDGWLKNENFRVEITAAGYMRHQYTLLSSGNSREVRPLSLVPISASLCNDMRIDEEPAP